MSRRDLQIHMWIENDTHTETTTHRETRHHPYPVVYHLIRRTIQIVMLVTLAMPPPHPLFISLSHTHKQHTHTHTHMDRDKSSFSSPSPCCPLLLLLASASSIFLRIGWGTPRVAGASGYMHRVWVRGSEFSLVGLNFRV